jgi:DNA-binding CsgD family transcriptional regulator
VRGIDLVTSVAWYWITRATTEGVRWLDAFSAIGRGNPEGQFWAYFLRGFLAVLKADAVAAPPAIQQAVATARELRQPILLAQALSIASVASNLAGDRAAALGLLDEASAVSAKLDDFPAAISVLQARAIDGFFGGDLAAVKAASSEGVRLSRDAGDLYGLEMMLLNLGSTALFSGDLNQASAFYKESLQLARRLDDRVAQYAVLDGLGYVAAGSGATRRAARLLGAAETIRTQAGAQLIPILAPMVAQTEASAVAALGQSTFDAEVLAGRRMSRDEAIRMALEEKGADQPAAASSDAKERVLASREADVARLIADGLSNKQIGARLFISERTVDSHVRSILNKLGFNARAQIAGWIATGRK